mmetsp:Transcript_39147/g.70211  ORF Transcript_39147/g.70211 Transcript_39147/m.70211 type:complete len:272 (-) Transcript_39147:5-820(-)
MLVDVGEGESGRPASLAHRLWAPVGEWASSKQAKFAARRAQQRQRLAEGLWGIAQQVLTLVLKVTAVAVLATVVLGALFCISLFATWTLLWLFTPGHADIELPIYLDYRQPLPQYSLQASKTRIPERGQYDVALRLTLPETPQNEEQGISCITFEVHEQKEAGVRQEALKTLTKCLMVRYRTPLLRVLHTLYYALPLIWGTRHLEDVRELPLLTDWTTPGSFHRDVSWWMTVTLSNPKLQVTEATLLLKRRLGPVQYLLFHWPLLTSALLG